MSRYVTMERWLNLLTNRKGKKQVGKTPPINIVVRDVGTNQVHQLGRGCHDRVLVVRFDFPRVHYHGLLPPVDQQDTSELGITPFVDHQHGPKLFHDNCCLETNVQTGEARCVKLRGAFPTSSCRWPRTARLGAHVLTIANTWNLITHKRRKSNFKNAHNAKENPMKKTQSSTKMLEQIARAWPAHKHDTKSRKHSRLICRCQSLRPRILAPSSG